MACQQCDHTMQMVSIANRVFWCPRCGTIKCERSESPPDWATPSVVKSLEATVLLVKTIGPGSPADIARQSFDDIAVESSVAVRMHLDMKRERT